MKKTALLILLCAGLLASASSCVKEQNPDEDLAPFLFQDSLRVWPNPAWLYEDAEFYFAWKDYDGDMDEPAISLRLQKDDGSIVYIEPQNLTIEGRTGGSIVFDRTILDGDEGRWYVVASDKAGNESNEIEIYLYVNPTPRPDETDDDTAEEL